LEISAECRDLLCRTLVADPAQRASMDAIQCHSWFLTNLPPKAVSMNDTYVADDDFSGMQTDKDTRASCKRWGACSVCGRGQAGGGGMYVSSFAESRGDGTFSLEE
jgi:hypothetical protein